MKYPKLRELKEAVTALIKGPYTSRYPFEPHVPAENFRGRPYFHEEDCTGCGACVQVCPTGALEYVDVVEPGALPRRRLVVHWDVCIFCGHCQANCLTAKGIMLSREFAFAVTENRESLQQSIEKELVVCDCCSEPVVPYDQYVWVVRKLGPLCFSNPSLILLYMRAINLAVAADTRCGHKAALGRADGIKVLCPRCRREAAVRS